MELYDYYNMIEDKDVEKLIGAFKEVFPTKLDFDNFKDEYRKDFSNMQTSVDAYAHKADKYFQEMVAWSGQIKRHEKWLKEIADKIGIKLEY